MLETLKEKQGYKKTELGWIPEDWEVKLLNEVFNFTNGKAHEQSIDENGEYVVINSKFISTDGAVRKYSNQNICPLYKNDVVMVMSDVPNGRAMSKCFYIDQDGKYTLNQRICSLRAKNDNNPKYLYYVTSRNKYFLAFDNGVSQTNLRKEDVLNCPLIIPSVEEQDKIVKILSTVDEKIEKVDKQIEQAEQLKKALMQELLTKGIGHTEFKDTEIGRIPVGWEIKKGKEITSKITKGASPKWQGFDYQDDGTLFVTSENVRDGYLDITSPKFLPLEFNDKLKNSQLKKYDILINIVGASIGRTCQYVYNYEAANINQAVCLFRLKDATLSEFVLYYLQAPLTISRLLGTQNGSARQNLSLNDINNFIFVIPTVIEQKKIAEILTSADEKLEILQNKKSEYEKLKKGLMQKLLTGQIRVRV